MTGDPTVYVVTNNTVATSNNPLIATTGTFSSNNWTMGSNNWTMGGNTYAQYVSPHREEIQINIGEYPLISSSYFIIHNLDTSVNVKLTGTSLASYLSADFTVTQIRFNPKFHRLEFRILESEKPEYNTDNYIKDNTPLTYEEYYTLFNTDNFIQLRKSELPLNLDPSYETIIYSFQDSLLYSDNRSILAKNSLYKRNFEINLALTVPNPVKLTPEYSYITLTPDTAKLFSCITNISQYSDIDSFLYDISIFKELIPDFAKYLLFSASCNLDVKDPNSFLLNIIPTIIKNRLFY